METKAIIAIIVVVLLVVGVNGVLYLMMRKSQVGRHFRLWQQAANRARNPWQEENDQLNELSKLVENLKKDETRVDQQDTQDAQNA